MNPIAGQSATPQTVGALPVRELVTGRLVLRPLTELHARTIIRAGNRSPGYPAPSDIEAAGDFLARYRWAGNPQPFGAYEIRLRSTGKPIGGAGFNRPLDDDGVTTIGYGLTERARGNGYATEALKALLVMAKKYGAREVRGSANLSNVASQRVMKAAGMTFTYADEFERFYEMTWD